MTMADTISGDVSRGNLSSVNQSASEPPSDADEDRSEEEDAEESEAEDNLDKKSASQESTAKGLRGDLEDAFSMGFNFKGDFAFASKLPDAPNPGLQIAPLGLIGLPLSERDAQSIKGIASQAPFGLGDQLVVDTNVRHTWEIEPANTITFVNPAWDSFIDSVANKARHELGVPLTSKTPKCELYKLLLYESGSHFLPHQDTEKAPGMFATIVIVLPSFYAGGQVCVSHGSKTKIFDFSSDGFATCMLTWYADVVHEVKPITSGHRLALSYNLIHEEASVPVPTVPSTSLAHTKLRGILQKWSKGQYSNPPPQIAYVLDHKYSQIDLGSGGKALKGRDAQLVTALRQIASEEGVELALAELECRVVGSAGEDFDTYGDYHKRMRSFYDEDSDDYGHYGYDEPTMDEEESRTTKISSLVDLGGNQLIGKESIVFGDEELIPSDPFEDADPDDRDYEGYMGNYPGDVTFWYRRVVLVLYLKADSHGLLLRAGGAPYAMSQLKLRETEQPSSLDLKFATYVIGHLNSSNTHYGKEREWVAYMLELALRWRDSEMWLNIASKIGPQQSLDVIGEDKLDAAWTMFGFDTLRPFFRDVVAQRPNVTAQMVMIDSVLRRAKTEDDKTKVSTWCEEQKALALAHLKAPMESDVPMLISVMKSNGVQFFVDVLQLQFSRHKPSFAFLLTFVAALHKEKESLSTPQPAETTYKQVVQFCLTLAISQWKVSDTPQYWHGYHGQTMKRQGPSPSFTRVKEIVELCFVAGQAELCRALFVSLINDKVEIGVKFKDYFIPLVPVLRHTLNSRNIPLHTYPFGDFFRYAIETFLTDMLGAKSGKMRQNVVRKVGCGCVYCQDLDKFLLSVQDRKVFRYKLQDRRHMEQRLAYTQELATFRTIASGSPHGLEVTKHPEVVAGQTWEGRQGAARNFLGSFGGDASLKLIMGARFTDVCLAVSGERSYSNVAKPFVLAARAEAGPSQTTQSAVSTSTGSTGEIHPPPTTNTGAPANSNIAAGAKRTYLGFIDISDSP